MRTPTGLPTASRLQLAVACPASQALPVVDSHHAAADEGTDLHDLLKRALRAGVSEPNAWLDGVLETIGTRLVGAVAEMAFAFHPTTGNVELLGVDLGRHYPWNNGAINGSVDYVYDGGPGGKALVVDLKTGLADVPAVARNQQLRFAALVVGRRLALPVQTAILHAPRDGRRPWWEWGPTYDALDLVEVADVFRSMAERIGYARKDVAAGRTPRLNVGAHCTYCPARLRCPAQVESIKLWAGEPIEVARDMERALTVDTAGHAWARVEAAEAALKAVKASLYAFAAQQPFPLADGRMVGKHQKRGRDDVDAERAFAVLRERHGVDVAIRAMTLKASRSSIRDAVGETAPRGQKRAAGDAIVRDLVAAGVVTEKWTEDLGPYDPRDNVESAAVALPSVPVESPATGTPVFSPPGDGD